MRLAAEHGLYAGREVHLVEIVDVGLVQFFVDFGGLV